MTWTAPHLGELPPWPTYGRVGLDIETHDEKLTSLGAGVRRGGEIVGVSFAIEHGPAFYLPLAHAGGGNYGEPELALLYLRDQAARFKGEIVGANLGYDLDYLAEAGIVFPHAKFLDVQNAGPLTEAKLEPGGAPLPMNLDAIAKRLGLGGKVEDGITRFAEEHGLHPKKDLWKMPAHIVAPYAIGDVELPLKVIAKQERILDRWREEDLEAGIPEGRTVWDIYEIECALLPILIKMRRRGVRVDLSKLEQIQEIALREQHKAMRQITTLSGVNVDPDDDVMRNAALAPALEADGLVLPLTAKGKPSIRAPWLAEQSTPVALALIEARKYYKIRTTFVTSIRKHGIYHGDEMRIHPTFNQIRSATEDGDDEKGAAFGRLSSSDPNIQQQPARDPVLGPLWRSLYLPDKGGLWACNDYSQQEPRWVTHFAELIGADGADVAAGRYREDPRTDNHSMMAELTGLKRKDAKQIFLGKLYGMGGAKFCHSVGLPTVWERPDWANGRRVEMPGREGKEMLRTFERRAPYVKALSKKAQRTVEQRGFIRTVLGRRCYFAREGRGYFKAYKALNRLIQGSSGDQMKKAMVDLDRAGYAIQIQVHDEVDQTVESVAQAKEIAEIMIAAVPANVPFVVDTEVGEDWGHLKEVA